MLTEIQKQEFEKEWDLWTDKYVEKGRLYTHKRSVADALPEIRKMALAYIEKYNGFVSQSVFDIVVNLMLENGDLAEVRDKSHPDIPAEMLDFIQKAESGKISTFELRRRYMSDRAFRDAYDQYTGLAALATPQSNSLTADEYHRIPVRTAQARYRQDPSFKEAVDRLAASGAI